MSISGMRSAVKAVAEHATAAVRLQRELASVELKQKAGKLGAGAGLLAAAAFLAALIVPFALATIAVALALVLPWWLSLLIVTLVVALVAVLLAFIGVKLIKKGSPPVPVLAIEEAKRTKAVFKR
jgi:hypothetical protein